MVAYARAELLSLALAALQAQSAPLGAIVVVDNASPDNSSEIAHAAGADVVSLPRNTGGAGGFTAGIARAIAHHRADLVWVMDDDTIPEPDALAQLLEARSRFPGHVSALASRVVWIDGRDHPMNTPRPRPRASASEIEAAARVGAIPVRSMSFVSMLMDAGDVGAAGLPVSDFFLWNDDFEFSARLLRNRVGLYVPASVVEHRTKRFGSTDVDPGDRFYLEVRNKVWTLGRSSAFAPADRALYSASTIARWGRTLRASQDRGRLVRVGSRGLWHGLTRRPAANSTVLADMGETTAEVTAMESPVPPVPLQLPATDEGFSVLLPVYIGDDPLHVARAVKSVTSDQALMPDELVIVRDGPVAESVERLLIELEASGDVPTRVVRFSENAGLSAALEAGLAECRFEIVARADADDISVPERFAVQVPLVRAGIDIVGSAIVEFDEDETVLGVVRQAPLTTAEISAYARFHDPFNHPSVVYRRTAVRAAGGYRHLALMEDYWLFARMIAQGARTANVPQALVKYRVGAGAYGRRGGRRLLASEIELQRHLHAEGFTTSTQALRNVALRGGYRLIPQSVRQAAYRALVLGPKNRRVNRALGSDHG